MQHTWHVNVLNVRKGAGYFGRNILTRDRATHDRVVARVLGACVRRYLHLEALAAGSYVEVQTLAGNEVAVCDLLISRAADLDDALARDQAVGGNLEMLGCKVEEHRSAGGRGLADLRAGQTNREAAVARSLIHGLRSRPHHHIETIH